MEFHKHARSGEVDGRTILSSFPPVNLRIASVRERRARFLITLAEKRLANLEIASCFIRSNGRIWSGSSGILNSASSHHGLRKI